MNTVVEGLLILSVILLAVLSGCSTQVIPTDTPLVHDSVDVVITDELQDTLISENESDYVEIGSMI